MKLFFILLFLPTVLLADIDTDTGTSPMGPAPTLSQPTYPNSGERTRTDDMTGEGMSNATMMSSDVNPTVPTETPSVQGNKSGPSIKPGPYKAASEENQENPIDMQAQQAMEKVQIQHENSAGP